MPRWDSTWPENGVYHDCTGFLFFPLTINGETRWLMSTSWVEQCVHYYKPRTGKDSHYGWEKVRWGNQPMGKWEKIDRESYKVIE